MRRLLRCLLLLLPFGALASPADAPRIIDRPIRFTEERIELTREYLGRHYGLAVERITIVPQAIVVHWTGIRTLRGSWRAFDRVRVRGRRKRLRRAGAVNVSAHFLVDRDGTIYRLMPETWMARHCIGLNYDAIGIENVGGGGAGALTGKQLEANARLVRYLAGKHPIRYLLGHHEWRRFEKAPFFRERDPHYRHHKADPGPGFMRRLRKRLRDLQLEDRYRQGVTPPASPLKNGSEQPAPRADAAPTRQQAAQMYRWPRRASDYAPLSQRVSAPRSHRRVSAAPGSFALWLRHLPLLPAQTPVRAFDGSQILRPDHPALAAVVDLDLGQRDRQQCADTIMRLWGEYLASQGRAKQVRFGWTGRRRFGFD